MQITAMHIATFCEETIPIQRLHLAYSMPQSFSLCTTNLRIWNYLFLIVIEYSVSVYSAEFDTRSFDWESHKQIKIHAQPSLEMFDPVRILYCGAPRGPSNKLSSAKSVLPWEMAPWDPKINFWIHRHECQAKIGKSAETYLFLTRVNH